MPLANQHQPAPPERAKSLVVLWPDDLFDFRIRENYGVEVFDHIMSILEIINSHRGNMVVVDSETSIYQDGFFRYQVDRKLFELASAGYSVRKILQAEEDDDFSCPEAVEEWQGFGGDSDDLIYWDKTKLWKSLTPILKSTDVLLLGGTKNNLRGPGDTTIYDAANVIRWLCYDVEVDYSIANLNS